MNTTGANARMVVIDKPKRKAEQVTEARQSEAPAIHSTIDGEALPPENWMSVGDVTNVAAQCIQNLAHQPPIVILDSERDILGQPSPDGNVSSGMTYNGKIYLFRDGLADATAVELALWHELLHYGLRRFLTKDQYIAKLNALADRDVWLRQVAEQWTASEEGQQITDETPEYVRARGVDGALAKLSEIYGKTENGFKENGLRATAFRAVVRWLAELADFIGFHGVAAHIRNFTHEEAKRYVAETIRKVREDAPATSIDWAFTADPAFMRSKQADSLHDTASLRSALAQAINGERAGLGDALLPSDRVRIITRDQAPQGIKLTSSDKALVTPDGTIHFVADNIGRDGWAGQA